MRAAIVSPDERILLLCFPHPDDGERLWIMPGGGVEVGESPLIALKRELSEEVDFTLTASPPYVWHRTYTYGPARRRVRQTDTIYWVRADRFEARLDGNPDEHERQALLDARWWSVAELGATRERIVPRRLAQFLRQAIDVGPPRIPIDVGV